MEPVRKAFNKFDKNGSGTVTVADLEGTFTVVAEEATFDKFLESFGNLDYDGEISWNEWVLNYCGLSASFDNDDEFVLMMKNAWKLED